MFLRRNHSRAGAPDWATVTSKPLIFVTGAAERRQSLKKRGQASCSFSFGQRCLGLLRGGFRNIAASLLDFGLGVSAVKSFTGRLFSRLGNVGRTFRQILPMLLLRVNDLFVVSYISWIGHA